MSSSTENKSYPVFGLICTIVFINPVFLFRESERWAKEFISKKYCSDFLNSYSEKIEQVVMRISFMAKRVLSYFKKSFNKYKFKRFLTGIDFLKPILQTTCI